MVWLSLYRYLHIHVNTMLGFMEKQRKGSAKICYFPLFWYAKRKHKRWFFSPVQPMREHKADGIKTIQS